MDTTNLRSRISKINISRHLLIYVGLILVLAGGYSLLVTGISLILGTSIRADSPTLIGVIVFCLAFLIHPLQKRIQDFVVKSPIRGRTAYQEQLQRFSQELSQPMQLQEILDSVRKTIEQALLPVTVHIYLRENSNGYYRAAEDIVQEPTSSLSFSPDEPLPKYLLEQPGSLYLRDLESLPESLKPLQAKLVLLGALTYIPLKSQETLIGWFALVQIQSQASLSTHEVRFLEELADLAAIAIERAQVIADLERRVHEMNVLTRFSQGINITLALDDTLELIYTHANMLIPTRDFFITLYEKASDIIYHVFCLANDERLSQNENIPLPYGQGLEREIIKNRNSLIAFDYARECKSRGTLPAINDIYAWIGVPMNTGAEIIGVLSLGSRNSNVLFTKDQANLLQAVADQAAGAIIKSRLLHDAERRTIQLTMLNEVTREISATLSRKPLIQEILRGATVILNCEAGGLFLVNHETKELVLEHAVGLPSEELVGKNLPFDAGWLEKAVQTKKALIVNDINIAQNYSEGELSPGDMFQNMLVVPLLLKDDVTGVLSVANRRDGQAFSHDDQELITAFSRQAAVAIENVRIYTSTDQTLAERVEELSVMQQIDRELNTSLDVNRAMRLTLEWAMRQSKASAGLIGMNATEGLRVITSQGYQGQLDSFTDGIIPPTFAPVQKAPQNGLPHYSQSIGQDSQFILENAMSQNVIPIHRENEVIGILLLEYTQTEGNIESSTEFLVRLCDHAAIAIANARLYTEVQEANQAKSEFISFVSHELKTPMTSIRGYTDLLTSGIVGSINENQENFLSTIRSNVDRMATLVSDLTDVSRIEAGRVRLEFESVPVSEVVSEVVRSIGAQIAGKEQILEITVPEDLPPMWGDRNRLIQILTNLISNANKYTPAQGQINVMAEETKQGITKAIHLIVKDNGYGINPENQKNIFQKFYRSDDPKVRDTPGTGLGLNISKQLIELQGGQIWFESVYRSGSSFHITVPIAEIQPSK